MAATSNASGDSADGMTDINITPLVDIFLVLLVIVLVSSQLIEQRSVPVRLPVSSTAPAKVPPRVHELVLDAHNRLWLDGVSVEPHLLRNALRNLSVAPEEPLLVGIDESMPYREAIALLDSARLAGLEKVSLKLTGQP